MKTDLPVVDMLAMIARARLAEGWPAEDIQIELRSLQPRDVVLEFHRAVAHLDAQGILSHCEQRNLQEYASDYLAM